MAKRLDVVVLVFRRDAEAPYYREAVEDPGGFVDRRRDALNRLAAERLTSQRLFPYTRGPWLLVLPDADPVTVLGGVETLYGPAVAAQIGRVIARFPDAVVCWIALNVSDKGFDSAELRDAS